LACFDRPKNSVASSRKLRPELTRRAEQIHPGCKVLLFSGAIEAWDLLDRARGHGHLFLFYMKPLPSTVLLAEIKTLIGAPATLPVIRSYKQMISHRSSAKAQNGSDHAD
jgi:hypothetical protein